MLIVRRVCAHSFVCTRAPVFGLLEAKTAGKPIPGDVAYDKDGNSTTDPAAALQGAIRVFDRCAISACHGGPCPVAAFDIFARRVHVDGYGLFS